MSDTVYGAGIAVDGIGERYAERSADTLSAIDPAMPAGAFATLFGPSGWGKSTLLRLLARPNRPTRRRSVDATLTGCDVIAGMHGDRSAADRLISGAIRTTRRATPGMASSSMRSGATI